MTALTSRLARADHDERRRSLRTVLQVVRIATTCRKSDEAGAELLAQFIQPALAEPSRRSERVPSQKPRQECIERGDLGLIRIASFELDTALGKRLGANHEPCRDAD